MCNEAVFIYDVHYVKPAWTTAIVSNYKKRAAFESGVIYVNGVCSPKNCFAVVLSNCIFWQLSAT